MKILFLIQSNKINKAGLTSLWCRLTYNKTRKQFSTGMYIKPKDWDKDKQKVLEEAENSRTVNSQISLIKQTLGRAFLMLQIQGESFDVDDVYKIYCGVDTKKEMGVIAIYTLHNNYYRKLVGKDLKEVSWQKFENTKGHLQDFIKRKYKQNDIKLSKLKFQFIKDFEYYLRTEKEMQQSTINKTIQRFKKMINFTIAQEYLDRNPFLMHKPKVVKRRWYFLLRLSFPIYKKRSWTINAWMR